MNQKKEAFAQRLEINSRNYSPRVLFDMKAAGEMLSGLYEVFGLHTLMTDRHGDILMSYGDFEGFVPDVVNKPGNKIRVKGRTVCHIYAKYDAVATEQKNVVEKLLNAYIKTLEGYASKSYLSSEQAVYIDELEQELENLRTVKRKEVADKIKVARGYGDLSENAEYDAAKEEQASVEARIADLEATLKLARIMDESELSNDTASIGMHVKILAEGDDLEDAEEYDLTGSTEADMDLNRISDESPVGAALIGCKVGDSVDVTLPNGNIITYKLLEVSRSK